MPEFSILDELKWRELIFQVSDEEGFRNLTDNAQQAVYAGFDPTADSLHIGHIVPLIALRRFQLAGHTPIALVGGGTGLIGDPSGKSAERTLNELKTVEQFSGKLRAQIEQFLDFSAGACSAKLLNNYDWIGALSAIEYLRDLGKHFTINWMLAKDSVKSRIDRDTSGLSYTEFSYMILQAYDFLHLAENHGCRIQLGGSDQWGNMTAGTELIRRKLGSEAYIVTVPLITTASGAKFGKTEGGAIWLDPEKTSPYAFYQYWINIADQDAIRFLKYFTFMKKEEIDSLAEDLIKNPDNRPAQKALAYEMTTMTHGKTAADEVIAASEALFGKGELEAISLSTLESAVSAAPSLEVDDAGAIPALDQLLTDLTLCSSKGEAKKLILSGGVYANNIRIADIKYRPEASQLLHGKLMIIRKGKKHYAIVKVK
ncbi:MAG: tyrosine--tRNA ligase [bacterium]